ncbi:MAG: cobalamin biosynthesis protein [Selenomonas sp.]|uniref:cobalt-precorrin 5A hydrolase n=1 Tax=Selenomonas sp. TaxID=2053611 RepID=UPI0025E62065|nr:cobalamin biosynthesis protein [Selenomonas sp.]MCI6086017.1 cobalamin biosynthesis protein [Selenomonas sp.]
MRTAILALTAQGARTARRVRAALVDADVFVSRRVAAQADAAGEVSTDGVHASDGAAAENGGMRTFGRIAQVTAEIFAQYDALVFIMAAGIVVRSIAPLVRDKLADPAVVVLDEQARHVISLLSGHVGGANALARQLAAALGADPVITTATDVEGLAAPDAVAAQLGLMPWPHGAILNVNRALLDGARVRYVVDASLPLAAFYRERLAAGGAAVVASDVTEMTNVRTETAERSVATGASAAVDVVLTHDPARFPAHQRRGGLFLRPMRLVAGVGCRRNTPEAEVLAALADAAARIGVPQEAIAALASTVVKRDEAGLLSAADALGVPINFFSNETLAEVIETYGLRESSFVKQTIGVGNVAEAAALAEAGRASRIAVGKTKYEKVTVALVWQTSRSSVSDRAIWKT